MREEREREKGRVREERETEREGERGEREVRRGNVSLLKVRALCKRKMSKWKGRCLLSFSLVGVIEHFFRRRDIRTNDNRRNVHVIMLSDADFLYCYAESHYDLCHRAVCCFVECCYVVSLYVVCHFLMSIVCN